MAKSVRTIVTESILEVSHGSEEHVFDMPEWFQRFGEEGVMDDEDKIVEIAKTLGVLHGLLHNGIQQTIIGMRSATRPTDKKGVKQSMLRDLDGAQLRLSEYRPKVIPIPNVGKVKTKPMTLEEVIAEMRKKGSSDEEIKDYFMKEMAKS